ncbi:MAG: DNA-directed RNA polymerase subunit alpha, partial [Smithella sp.]|nr:DNA-directed RNA polymerase subunit alpha [Smithella sp.]
MVLIMQRNWSRLIRPRRIEVDDATHTRNYGEFIIQPLERGFGITLGNVLRRILLSSIQGAAIVSTKIEGVLHEFSTLPGIKEDITDIILNLKGVRFKLAGPADTKEVTINVARIGAVTAADIITDGAIEVLNPDHHIATIASGSFKAKLIVKVGKGYLPAKKELDPEQSKGTINIDAIFSPVKKVNYIVSHAR